jgi:hypothetical protein
MAERRFILIWNMIGILVFSAGIIFFLFGAAVFAKEHLKTLEYFSAGRTIKANVVQIERSARSGQRAITLEWEEDRRRVEHRLDVKSKSLRQCGTKVGAQPKCEFIELFDGRNSPLGLYVQSENDPRKWWVRFPWGPMFFFGMSIVCAALVRHIWNNRRDHAAWDLTF